MRPALSLATGSSTQVAEGAGEGRPWWERGAAWLGDAASGALEFGEEIGWRLLNQFAPELVPIIRQGPLEWLKERLTEAVETVFDSLMAPVRPLAGIAGAVMSHFSTLLAWIREAAARIARGDCGAITEAVERIRQVFEGIAAPIVDRIKQLATSVREFFSGLWDRFGAPVWQFLQRLGGQAWEQIQRLGRWIWERTAPIRNLLARAWTWVKNKLGIGEGPEGQDGILQWVQRKAQEVWDQHLRPFIERHRRPLIVVAGILLMMSPAGPFIAIGAIVGGLIIGIGWIRRYLRTPDGVVNQRDYLRQVIIPGILSAISRVSTFLTDKARLIADRLTEVVSGLNQAVGALAGSILRFAVRIFEWLLARFQALVAWALQGLLALAEWITSAFNRLRPFLQNVHDALVQVLRVVSNMMELPMLLAGRVWNAIPPCIRDPFVNYFIPLILRQISFFRELVGTPEAWSQTRTEVMTLVRQVFRTFDLWGAMRSAFNLLLRALNVPVDLARQVWEKASQAWDAVLDRPIQFIRNIFLAVGQGFVRFFGNILSHLGFGIQGWLFNSVRDMGISPPSSWTDLRAVFGFVLDVLGISLNHVLDLLERQLLAGGMSRAAVTRVRSGIRTGIRVLGAAWECVRVALDEGPSGLWRMLVDRLRDLGQMVLESAIGWVMQRIIVNVSARITALASSAGLGSVLEAFLALYRAIQTAIEYARRILEILSTVLDTVLQIARGVLGPAAEMLERGLRMAMPVVIGFLANYLGLGGIGERIREIITSVRERVDAGILWLIDRALAAGRAVLDALGQGVAAVRNWWQARHEFRSTDGESHSVSIEGQPATAEIIVQSRRTNLRELINQITDADDRREASGKAAEILSTVRAGRDVRDEAQLDQNAATLTQKLGELAAILVRAGVLDDQEEMLPAPEYSFAPRGGKAKHAEVRNLSANRSLGSTPFEDPVGWDYVTSTGQTTGAPYFRRLHLINRLFGGPGMRSNLAPGPQQANSDHLHDVENPIKLLVGDQPNTPGKTAVVTSYTVDVEYHPSRTLPGPPAVTLSAFPRSFECAWRWVDRWPRRRGATEHQASEDVTIGPPT